MAPNVRLPPKKDVALALLERSSVYVHLDPRGERVQVPVGFKKQPQLVLEIGLNMALPIPDLDVGDDGLSCTLSFNRVKHFCSVPWGAVFALVSSLDQRGMVWPEDVPPEVAGQADAQRAAPKPRPELSSVPAPQAALEAQPKEAPKKRRAKKVPVKAVAAAGQGRRPEEPAPAAKPVKRSASKKGKLEQHPPSRAAAESTPSKTNAVGAPKKRQLPPYLRVVK